MNKILSEKEDIGLFPTPLHRLNNLEDEISKGKIYIKRDDLSGIGPGGNKIRSLEYILRQAKLEKADVILVSGPLQSNLVTLAAASCNKLNLECIAVLNGEKPTKLEGNLLLNELLGIESHYIGNCDSSIREEKVDEVYKKLIEDGRNPYIVENGASTSYGALGYVNAVFEILDQCKKENIEIEEIYAPGGNGGIATGLIVGNVMAGYPFNINIISVESDKEELSRNIENIIEDMKDLGIEIDGELKDICNIIDDYRGQGWGHDTEESRKIVSDFPKLEGIFIENVYNSKVVVGMVDILRKRSDCKNVCYIHTGGFGSLFSQF